MKNREKGKIKQILKRIFFQTYLIYFSFLMLRLNNFKIHKVLTNFNYILFSFIFYLGHPNIRVNHIFLTFFFFFLFFYCFRIFFGIKYKLKQFLN